jgi:hypothetical protein
MIPHAGVGWAMWIDSRHLVSQRPSRRCSERKKSPQSWSQGLQTASSIFSALSQRVSNPDEPWRSSSSVELLDVLSAKCFTARTIWRAHSSAGNCPAPVPKPAHKTVLILSCPPDCACLATSRLCFPMAVRSAHVQRYAMSSSGCRTFGTRMVGT